MFKKLSFYGIRGIALTWFKSYLTNRKQYVQYLNCKFETKTLLNGVPQGSVLGPLLFILYINDMPNILQHAKSVIFADDTTIYVTGNDIENLYIDMNAQLSQATDWFRANKLSVNGTKTNFMLFTNKNVQNNHSTLSINNINISQVNQTKILRTNDR